ncbi:MAG: hypothetical protein KDL87_07185, partial [Verrucomicrobiae bacterium]|nr:hypothetical protein [Verrucomicrobiae bacterium]
MSVEKEILVLANSIKKGGRCVAGREISRKPNGDISFGPWIRPIDPNHDEGTIAIATTIVGIRLINPLDIIRIQFSEWANDPVHPEDWNIVASASWRRTGFIESAVLDKLEDESGDLWGASRRVLPTGGIPTLRLVKPRGEVTIEAYMELTPWGPKHRRWLKLEHDGSSHKFSIDDPLFSQRHKLSPTEIGDQQRTFSLDPKKTVVVASLTPP